jgi:hypothetical protein
MARLPSGEQLAKVDILVEFEADDVVANPHDGRSDLLRGYLDIDLLARGRGSFDEGHQSAGGEVLDANQLLTG